MSQGLCGCMTHAPVRWNPNFVSELCTNEPPSLPSTRDCALARALQRACVGASYSPGHRVYVDVWLMHQFAGTQILCLSCARTSPQVCRAHAIARLHARCNARALVSHTHQVTGFMWMYGSCTSSLEPKFCVLAVHERAPKFAERTRLRACTRVATRVRWCLILT